MGLCAARSSHLKKVHVGVPDAVYEGKCTDCIILRSATITMRDTPSCAFNTPGP